MSAVLSYIPFSPSPTGSPTGLKSSVMTDPKEKFFRHFQAEVTLIQDEIESLATMSAIAGERQAGIDKVLAGISRLSNEVMDAADFIPSYDQRAYSQAIKALTEKLNITTGKFGPKSRFQFKPRGAGTTAGPAQAPPDPRQRRPWGSDGSVDTEALGKPAGVLPTIPETKNYNEEISRGSGSGSGSGSDSADPKNVNGNTNKIRKPSFSSAKNIAISGHKGLHIMLPSAASRATSSGSLTDLDRCVVDMALPTQTGAPFAGLTVKNVRGSLIIAGNVAGPAHITGVKDSVVVVTARQVRMHECRNVRVYLHCASHPIIEDCEGMAFAPLPGFYAEESNISTTPESNQWDKVDDFKWLKDTPSPNWRVLSEKDRLPDAVWRDTVCGKAGMNTDDILRELKI